MGEESPGRLYEFQGYDKWWLPIRGQITAHSRREAKRELKGQGLRWLDIWRHGGWYDHQIRKWYHGLTTLRIPTLKFARYDDNTLVYAGKNFGHFLLGTGLILGGLVFFLLAVLLGSVVLVSLVPLSIGIIFVMLGMAVLGGRAELRIDRATKRVFRSKSSVWGKRMADTRDGNTVEKVILYRETFLGEEPYPCYVGSLVVDGNRICLDISTSKGPIEDMTRKVADCLAVPFEGEV